MNVKTLGQRIRELRELADLSLRELARRIGVTAPFLSDVELGRRFPSEEVLLRLADALNVDVAELRKHDARQPVADFKELVEANPALGMAFRTAVEDVKTGKLSSEDLIKRLLPRSKK